MIDRWKGTVVAVLAALLVWSGPATASENADIVITVNRVIYPGQTVPADAVVETRLRKPLRRGTVAIHDAGEVIGMVAAKTILPRRLIAPSALREAYAVEAGETATIYYRKGSLTIAMDAVALQSAGFGKPVRMRNISSGRTVTGIVMPDGDVLVEAR
ncbi:flagellar basal body P-ring formation chaperone FlgA [Oricola indica]|jgi:flagella basal body P-ring formation protein FlgA|uniref:flagellar basal body P-ring formation chaperone FlgA n=1 Tax=Oricola indica TaxID=2872591 RepID=UPI001CBCF5B7|nr:flagellar basal body P-ring formation chaperone FlgA [Oricola indica]